MDFFGMIKAAAEEAGVGGVVHTLPPNRWDKVSINGHQIATVTAHGVGMKDGIAWSYFTFRSDEGGAVQTLWGEEDVHGQATISLADGEANADDKGQQMANARIAIQPIIQIFKAKTSVRYKFTDAAGRAMEYRFDGRSWP